MSKQQNISRLVAGGVAWMLALRLGLRFLGLISTMILARLLTPEDFGIVAVATSFYALLALIKDFGFDTAIIQMQNPEKAHYDTAWTFNFIFGIALAIVLICFSGPISQLYDYPGLRPLIWTIASLFIIGGVGNVGTLDFRKNLTFEKEFKLQMLPKLIGVPCTLLLAFWLKSYWALAIGTIVTTLVSLCTGYLMHSYRPSLNLEKAGELFNFSKWLMASNFIYFLNIRAPELLIGKMLNLQAAGIFTISNEISMMATTEVSSAVSRASYPGYSKVADQKNELKRLYLNVISSTAFLLFPIALGVAATAELLVPVFLGEQWLDAIPLIEIIAIGGLFMAINSNSGYVFMALGNPRLNTILGTFRILMFIPMLILFANKFGLIGTAYAVLLTASTMFVVVNYAVISRLPITVGDLIRSFYRPLFGSLLMLVVVFEFINAIETVSFLENVLLLIEAVLIGGAIYFAIVYAMWGCAGKPDGPELNCLKYTKKSIDWLKREA